MIHRIDRFRVWLWSVSFFIALAAVAAPRRASAQTAITEKSGLGQYYRSQRWFPVQVTLQHQGQPAKVEVRARFTQGLESAGEYRIPAHDLRSGANEQHTLYIRAPMSYSSQPLLLELYRDGRLINSTKPQINLVNEGDWLVAGIGGGDSTLKLLTTVKLTAQNATPTINFYARGQQPRVNVAALAPADVPDQWQGLQAADMVVLGDVSERELRPEQASALHNYVISGGTLVITGGTNWNRLTTPFFGQLLPVEVMGGTTLSTASGLRALTRGERLSGSYAAVQGRAKPGSNVLASESGTPLVVSGIKGGGRVIFVAFDPSGPPFRNWGGIGDFWKALMLQPRQNNVVRAISDRDGVEQFGVYNSNSGQAKLSDAPYAIPQLDIPAFYIVAIFLLTYIIVLVPVNYFVLKAKDKKEYAWLTTPAIVLIFSIGAYMIGYGFKGGRALIVKAGVVETRSGESQGQSLFYAGLFSPRKTSYDIRLADSSTDGAASATLFSDPATSRSTPPLRTVQQDGTYVEDYAVDMWAMRVVKGEGLIQLKDGVTAKPEEQSNRVTGTIRNGTPYGLEDCYLVSESSIAPVGNLTAGQEVSVNAATKASNRRGGLLPTSMLDQIRGPREEQRMKRAVLHPLCALPNGPGSTTVSSSKPLLVGWVRDPVNELNINGHAPRELAATLMVVHLGGR